MRNTHTAIEKNDNINHIYKSHIHKVHIYIMYNTYNLHFTFIITCKFTKYTNSHHITLKNTHFGCGHSQQKTPFPARSTVVKRAYLEWICDAWWYYIMLLWASPSSVVGGPYKLLCCDFFAAKTLVFPLYLHYWILVYPLIYTNKSITPLRSV